MSKLDVFEIKLENPGQPVLTGAAVRGEVLVRLKKDVDIARILVHLYGGGLVEFQDQAASVASRAVCEDTETFLRLAQIVYSKSGSNARRLSKSDGLCRYKFEFRLPQDLPSSFMTVIYYKLTAFLDCGGKSHEATQPLVVISDLDLNRYKGRLCLVEPIDSWSPSRSRTDTGLVSVRLVTTKRGYGFGESLAMQIEIFNNSKAKLDNLNACLVQKGTLKAFSGTGAQYRRVQRLLVKYLSLGKLRNGERLQMDELKIQVPWVVTSEIEQHTRLIEIQYFIQVTTSTQMISAVTGAPLGQIVCIGPDYRKSELVSVLLEEQIAIGVRELRDPAGQHSQQPQHHHYQAQTPGLYPNINGPMQAMSLATMPSAPPPSSDSSDMTMFTMVPTAPPSYDEALTHQKAPLPQPQSGAAAAAAAGDDASASASASASIEEGEAC